MTRRIKNRDRLVMHASVRIGRAKQGVGGRERATGSMKGGKNTLQQSSEKASDWRMEHLQAELPDKERNEVGTD